MSSIQYLGLVPMSERRIRPLTEKIICIKDGYIPQTYHRVSDSLCCARGLTNTRRFLQRVLENAITACVEIIQWIQRTIKISILVSLDKLEVLKELSKSIDNPFLLRTVKLSNEVTSVLQKSHYKRYIRYPEITGK